MGRGLSKDALPFASRRWGKKPLSCAAAVFALTGCGQILGVDEYRIAGPAACGSTGVPTDSSGTGCTPVGVTACPSGSTLDDSGGCGTVLLPSTSCSAGIELLGSTACVNTSNEWICPGSDYAPPPLTFIGDAGATGMTGTVYVKQGFVGKIDGTENGPFTTIADALNAVSPNGVVLVAAGHYTEDLVVDKPVQLIGACPDQVSITGSGTVVTPASGYPCALWGPKAAICVTSSASNSVIQGIDATGAGDGIAVVGATRVQLSQLEVTQTERYGIRVEELGLPNDTLVAAGVTLREVLVRGARGAGVYVAGASLDTNGKVTVAETRPLNDYHGYGVTVLQGATSLNLKTNTFFNPTSSQVTLSDAVLIGNADAALHVSGSTVTVTDSFLGNLDSVTPLGRGVFAERLVTLGNPAQVNLQRTIIQNTRDAAIDVSSGTVTLEDVTVRNTFGRAPDGCSGQGIRIRTDGLAPATATVTHSLIDESRQAAIHDLGATVTVTDSILRGAGPVKGETASTCAPHLGDGVTLEPLGSAPAPGYPSALTLDHTLIDGNARAGVANFGGTVTATNTVLSCNKKYGLVASGAGGVGSAGLLCGCGTSGGGLGACNVEHPQPAPERWISPGAASGHAGATEDWGVQVQYAFTETAADGVVLMPDFPEVAPGLPDGQGCASLHGVPKDLDSQFDNRRVAVGGATLVPGVWQVPPNVTPSCPTTLIGGASLTSATVGFTAGPPDSNEGSLDTTVPLAVVQQSPESGTQPWTRLSILAFRYNVDPGWYTITWPGVECVGNVLSGVPVPGASNELKVLVDSGMVSNAVVGECSAPDSCTALGFPDPAHPGKCVTGSAAQTACTALTPFFSAADSSGCKSCLCGACLPSYSACAGDAYCQPFVACAVATGCSGAGCLTPATCASEYAAAPGGAFGQSVIIAQNLGDCAYASGCAGCNQDAGASPSGSAQ